MTLDEMLALLPDNTSGQISAADLRAIVTALHGHGWVGNGYAYQWSNSTSALPATNKVNLDWTATGATVLHVSQQDGGGVVSPEATFGTAGSSFELQLNAGGSVIDGTFVGTFINQGNWYDVDVTIDTVTGPAPSNNALTTLWTLGEVNR